jgi:hypothetical protein
VGVLGERNGKEKSSKKRREECPKSSPHLSRFLLIAERGNVSFPVSEIMEALAGKGSKSKMRRS